MEPITEPFDRFLDKNYPLVRRAIRNVARRRRLNGHETDDLLSAVHLKLVDRDYAVLRSFRGSCTFSTYVQRVIERVWLDSQAADGKRWRPSLGACRLGATAIRLQQLLERDRLPFDQACEVLITNEGVPGGRGDLERLRETLPVRQMRPTVSRLDSLDVLAAPADQSECADPYHEALCGRLAAAVAALGDMERRLVRLRFQRGWTVARIARAMGCEQKPLYREFQRIFKQLRATMVPADTVVRLAPNPANPWDLTPRPRFNCSNGRVSAMPGRSMHSC